MPQLRLEWDERKNTTNVWPDFRALLTAQIGDSLGHYRALEGDFATMKQLPCNLDRGYAVLGVMLGKGLLTAHQATVAFADWQEARHAEFADRNVWGLYNAVTEGLKKGPAAETLTRHAEAHDFFVGSFGRFGAPRPAIEASVS